jgi:hypothetical protein
MPSLIAQAAGSTEYSLFPTTGLRGYIGIFTLAINAIYGPVGVVRLRLLRNPALFFHALDDAGTEVVSERCDGVNLKPGCLI